MELWKKRICAILVFLLILNFYSGLFVKTVEAGLLTKSGMLLYRMGTSRAASSTDPILIVGKTSTSGTEGKVKISFAAGFSVAVTVVASTASLPSTFNNEVITAWPLSGSNSSAISVTDVTFNSADLNTSTLYGFFITTGVTNPSSTGEKVSTITTQTSAPATIDTSRVVVDILSSAADAVTITASVPPTFNMSLSANSLSLGDLSTTSVTSGNITSTLNTNANNGWALWVRGTNPGSGTNAQLTSATASDNIQSAGSIDAACSSYSSGTAYYQLDADVNTDGAGGGTVSIQPEYNCSSTNGGTITRNAYQEVAYANGPGSGDIITLTAKVAAATLNKAADDYTDTWTVVGAGAF